MIIAWKDAILLIFLCRIVENNKRISSVFSIGVESRNVLEILRIPKRYLMRKIVSSCFQVHVQPVS